MSKEITPAMVFASYHWPDRNWESLTRQEKVYCSRAVLEIKNTFKKL